MVNEILVNALHRSQLNLPKTVHNSPYNLYIRACQVRYSITQRLTSSTSQWQRAHKLAHKLFERQKNLL